MNKKINKLKAMIDKYLHKSKEEVLVMLGKPESISDDTIWFYNRYRLLFFKDEISFIFKEDRVIDIMLCEFIMGVEIRIIFYYENETPEYKIFQLK